MAYAFRRDNQGSPAFTGVYEGPDGRRRSAGTFSSKRAAQRAAHREEQLVEEGRWRDRSLGATTFATYVETVWFPSKHIEASTRAGYRSNLDRHFMPYFGNWQMSKILPSVVQGWVTKEAADGLSPRSIQKYHTMLHSIFERAARDQLILINPCQHTELPKIIARRSRTLTPDEFGRLVAAVPDRHVLLVMTAIETGMRWGELIALRPPHRFSAPDGDRGGDNRRGVQAKFPHGGTHAVQAVPEGQRTANLRGTSRVVGRRHRAHPGPRHRSRRAPVQHRCRHTHLTKHLPLACLASRGAGVGR